MERVAQKINILLVDDNPGNLLALEEILQAPDRNLVRAASGDEALRYLLDCDVAVILLDVYMPGINGLETAALIRGRERSRNTPIIFLTADNTGGALLSEGYSLGAVDYIMKPVEPDILRSKVAVFVELFKKTEEVKRQAALLHEKNLELENANLERLSMLIDLGQQLAAERDPANLLEKFCEAARHIVGARFAAVGMLNDEGQALQHSHQCSAQSADDAQAPTIESAPQIEQRILDTMLVEGVPVRLCHVGAAEQALKFLAPAARVRSFLGAPILLAGRAYGWLCLADKLGAEEFSEADERLAVTLTSQVAAAYENAQLYTEAEARAAELQQEIIEREQAEMENAQLLVREKAARAEAEAANRMKDEFLATLSHELRTPLTAILGWSHLLRTGKLPPVNIESAIETIERNAKAQSQLIDDLLDVSRIITGKLRLEARPIAPAGIIEAAVNSVRPAAEAKDIQLDLEIASIADFIMGDPNRLQQVAWNLLSNAIKFTGAGGNVRVHLARVNSHVEIVVRDTGQGIGADFLPHVFDRFRQADGTTTRTHGGLGLGLAIVRHLVELHGGTINASSPGAGLGATFTVKLPLLQVRLNEGEMRIEGTVAEQSAIRNLQSAILEGLRVLVVDDEDDTRELIATVLTRCGAEVKAAANVPDALTEFVSFQPDLLISDIGIPVEDGYSLIKKVRAQESAQRNRIPAIALTAYANLEDRLRALSAGYQMHIAKPLDPSELIALVATLAGRSAKV
jgi:signal transduction histidine kinase/DNA-binding response OmpR family regulator